MTYSAWYNIATIQPSAHGGIIGKGGDDATTEGYTFRISNGFLRVNISDGTTLVDATSTPSEGTQDNQWHHVVAVVDRDSAVRFYVDGVFKSQHPGVTILDGIDITNAGKPLNIGRWNANGWYIDGQIDDVRIYNYALNPTQIRTVYNEGSAIRIGPLTGSP